MQKSIAALCLALVALAWPSASHANGRFPRANQLLVDPSDSSHLVLRATYGILISHDAGKTFGWVCESALDLTGDLDPAVAVFEDGGIVAGFSRDLRVSRADGCSWPSPFSNGSKENLVDATGDPSDLTSALFVSRRTDSAQQAHLLLANQDLSTPTPLGTPLGDDLSPLTLEVAPSMPERIYVTAIAADFSSVLLRSDDRGESWQRLPIEPHPTLPAFIAAIDPVDADRVYLRLDDSISDFLLVTDDGGATFSDVFSFDTEMLGFALSPDGTHVAVGGPAQGLFLATAEALEFERSPAPIANLSCLKWTDEALFACGNETADGFTLATSADGGKNFSPLFHIADLTPLSCDAKTDVGERCGDAWPDMAKRLGISDPDRRDSSKKDGGCGLPRSRGTGAGSLAGALALVGWLVRRRWLAR